MMMLNNVKIGTRLGLAFGVVCVLTLILVGFAISGLRDISREMEADHAISADKLDPLYDMREALGQTGISARNAFIISDLTEAKKELDKVDAFKVSYLAEMARAEPRFVGNA